MMNGARFGTLAHVSLACLSYKCEAEVLGQAEKTRLLSFVTKSGLSQFPTGTFLIRGLQQAGTQRTMDLDRQSDDLLPRSQGIYYRCRTLCDLRALCELCVESDRPHPRRSCREYRYEILSPASDFVDGMGL